MLDDPTFRLIDKRRHAQTAGIAARLR